MPLSASITGDSITQRVLFSRNDISSRAHDIIPFCPPEIFPFRFPAWRVHAPRNPPPQKIFCTLLYTSIAHTSHKTCRFFASECTIRSEFFTLRSRALVFATRAPPSPTLITNALPLCSHGLISAAALAHLVILSHALMITHFLPSSVFSLTHHASVWIDSTRAAAPGVE